MFNKCATEWERLAILLLQQLNCLPTESTTFLGLNAIYSIISGKPITISRLLCCTHLPKPLLQSINLSMDQCVFVNVKEVEIKLSGMIFKWQRNISSDADDEMEIKHKCTLC